MLYDNKEFIGSKIKEYRKKRHLTQEKLAELVNICDKHVGRIEAGIFFPACNTFLKIMDVLKIDIKEFGIDIESEKNITKTKILNLVYEMNENETNFCYQILKIILNEYRK